MPSSFIRLILQIVGGSFIAVLWFHDFPSHSLPMYRKSDFCSFVAERSPIRFATPVQTIKNADPQMCTEVTNAATAAASKLTGMSEKQIKEPGVLHELWSGILDDMLGAKTMSKA